MKKTTYNLILFLAGINIFTSCEYIIKKDRHSTKKTASVRNDKLKAKLLVRATQQNLNTIALCRILENVNTDPKTKNAIHTIIDKQVEMYENLQSIAKENLVLVAISPKIQPVDTEVLKNEEAAKDDFLLEIQQNLDIQKDILDSLTTTSSNKDIVLEVAKDSVEKLRTSIEVTECTLENLR